MKGRLDPSLASEARRLGAREERFGVSEDGRTGSLRAPDLIDAAALARASDNEVSDEERQAAITREVLQEDRIPFEHSRTGWQMPTLAIPAGASDSEAGSDLLRSAGMGVGRGMAMSLDRPADGALEVHVTGLEDSLSHRQWDAEDAEAE